MHTVVGTSVAALALLTYFKTHASRLFVTISKQRIRSSARYMLRSAITRFSVLPLKETIEAYRKDQPRSARHRASSHP